MGSPLRKLLAAVLAFSLFWNAGTASAIYTGSSHRDPISAGIGGWSFEALAIRPRWIGKLPFLSALFRETPPIQYPSLKSFWRRWYAAVYLEVCQVAAEWPILERQLMSAFLGSPGVAMAMATPRLFGIAGEVVSAEELAFAFAINHIEHAQDAENPEVKIHGYQVIIIASSDKDDQRIQEEQFNRAFGHQSRIIAVYLPVSGGGPFIDSFRAFDLASKEMPELINWRRSHKKIAMILNAGQGVRDEPITSAEFGSRGAMKIGGEIPTASGDPVPRTLANTAYELSSEFADPEGDYFDVYYANQFFVPEVNIRERPSAPFVKQAVPIVSPTEITEDVIRECGFFETDERGRLIRNVPARAFQTVKEARNWVVSVQNKNGHHAYLSLGSHRYRQDLFLALYDHYRNRLGDKDLVLSPPDLVNALLHLADGLDAAPSARDSENAAQMLQILRANAPRAYEAFIALRMSQDVAALYFQLRDRAGFGRDPRNWVGLMPMSGFWSRYRRPLHLLNNQLLMLTDLTADPGYKIQIDESGNAVQTPATPRDLVEASVARKVHGVDFPIQHCNLGGIVVNVEGRVPEGTKIYVDGEWIPEKTQITVKDVRRGIKVGGVSIKGSVVIDSDLPRGSHVVNSVVYDRKGPLNSDASYVVWSKGERLGATNALVYGMVNRDERSVNGRVVADVFRAGLPEDDQLELEPGQARMWADYGVYSDLADPMVTNNDNRYSTQYLRTGIIRNPKGDLDARRHAEEQFLEEGSDYRKREERTESERRILIVGTGLIGKKLAGAARKIYTHVDTASLDAVAGAHHHVVDYTDEEQVRRLLLAGKYDVVVFSAGLADVDAAEQNEDLAIAMNATPVDTIAKYFHGQFIYFSSDYVYDGTNEPYEPSASPTPMNAYGRSHALGERKVAEARQRGKENLGEGFRQAVIMRCSVLYGYNDEDDRPTFVREVVRALEDKTPIAVDNVQIRRPVDLDTMAGVVMDKIRERASETVHVGGQDRVTKYEWARLIATIYHRMFPHSFAMTLEDMISRYIIAQTEMHLAGRPVDAGLMSHIPIPSLAKGLENVVRQMSDRMADGSYSMTMKVRNDRGGWTVTKEALAGGEKRLLDEIFYLLNLPPTLRAHFPSVLTFSTQAGHVFYSWPFYPMKTLNEMILDEGVNEVFVLNKMRPILDFFFTQLIHYHETTNVPLGYTVDFQARRIRDRMAETLRLAAGIFEDIVTCPTLVINGVAMRNILPLLNEIELNASLKKHLDPPSLARVGGNMDFSNILVTPERDPISNDRFILGDVWGGQALDPIYDVAKFMMSIIGKFDFLTRDLIGTKVEKSADGMVIDLTYPVNLRAWRVYAKLEEYLREILPSYFLDASDPHWVYRLAFVLASHFASNMHFQLKGDGEELRATAVYAIGVVLMNEFISLVNGEIREYHGLNTQPLFRAA